MWKWILTLLIAFLGTWIFAKQYIPERVKSSGFGEMVDVALFPIEYRIERKKFTGGRYGRAVVNLTDAKFRQVLDSADKKNMPLVVYMYTTDCVFCRIAFHQISEVANRYTSKQLAFLVVSMDEDPNRNKFLLNTEDQLRFRPFITEPKNITEAKYYYQKKDIGIDVSPVLLFRNRAGDYENIGVDYSSKSRLEAAISKGL